MHCLQIDIYGLADATRRRANGMGKSLQADGAILSRMDLSTAVRARPDLKVQKEICSTCHSGTTPQYQQQATVRSRTKGFNQGGRPNPMRHYCPKLSGTRDTSIHALTRPPACMPFHVLCSLGAIGKLTGDVFQTQARRPKKGAHEKASRPTRLGLILRR